jgi:hypothetical protein
MNWRAVWCLTLFAIAICLPAVHAQQRSSTPRDLLNVLPSALDLHAAAIGTRVLVPGKERTIFAAILQNDRGERTPIRIAVQLPNVVRLEGLRPNGAAIVFDGTNPVYSNSRVEEQLVEIFSADTAEGMLFSIRDGAAVHLMGRRVLIGTDAARGNSDVRQDIFEVAGPIRSSAARRDRLKQYFFDSDTGLLVRTQYFDEALSPPVSVEVLFSNWRKLEGSAYPGRIELSENGLPSFSLTVSSVVALPRQDLTSFTALVHAGPQEE